MLDFYYHNVSPREYAKILWSVFKIKYMYVYENLSYYEVYIERDFNWFHWISRTAYERNVRDSRMKSIIMHKTPNQWR
jgi:hypothetical protein